MSEARPGGWVWGDQPKPPSPRIPSPRWLEMLMRLLGAAYCIRTMGEGASVRLLAGAATIDALLPREGGGVSGEQLLGAAPKRTGCGLQKKKRITLINNQQ